MAVDINERATGAGGSSSDVSSPSVVAAAGGGIPYRPQIITTRCGVNYSKLRNGCAGSGWGVRMESRIQMYVGASDVNSFQLALMGYVYAAAVQAPIGNDYAAEAALENSAGTAYAELDWPDNVRSGNSNLTNVPNGVSLKLSNPITGFSVAAGGSLWVRIGQSVASSALILPFTGSFNLAAGDSSIISPSSVSQIPGTGALSTPVGGQGLYPPAIVPIGIPKTPVPSVYIIGDSIAAGVGDTLAPTATGAYGLIVRGLDSVNGKPIAAFNQSLSGVQLAQQGPGYTAYSLQLLPYCTHVIIEAASNDIASGASLASIQNTITNLVTAIKAVNGPYGKPLKVYVTKVLPRVTSSNSFVDAAGQTPVAGFTVGGVRDTYNTWLSTQVGGLLDGIIDPNIYVEDQSNPGKWISTGAANYATTDGIHPSTAAYILGTQAVNAAAATFTV